MSWLQIDDAMPANRKISPLSDPAFRMHMHGLCHCAQGLTDGFIDMNAVQRMHPRWRKLIRELTGAHDPDDAPLWAPVDRGYQINDYLDYNPSREEVLAAREKKREAGRKGGEARAKALAKADAKARAVAPAKADAQAKSKQSPHPHTSESDEPDGSSSSSSAAAPRRRDVIWDAFVAECGPAPQTPSGRGAWNKAAKEIREAPGDRSLDEVRFAFRQLRKQWPNITPTPTAVAKHWTSLTSAANGKPRHTPSADEMRQLSLEVIRDGYRPAHPTAEEQALIDELEGASA